MGASSSEGGPVKPSETTPLLPQHANGSGSIHEVKDPQITVKDDDLGGHVHGIPGGTVQSAMFNLSNTIVGAGIMGLPATLKILGVPLGLITLILVGLLSEYSLQRLLKCTLAARAWSYGDLMSATYGRLGRWLLRGTIVVHNIGILVVFLIIIGDVLSGSNSGDTHYLGLLEEWAGGPAWWTRRAVVLSASMLFVIGPLAALPQIDSLHFTSGLSLLLAVVFVVITIVVTLINLCRGDIQWNHMRVLPKLDTPSDFWALFSVIPTMATAFTCHYNVHPIFVELTPPRTEKMQIAIRGTLTLCTSVYFVTALFGYMLFGDATYSDVLANFDQDLNVPYSEVLNDVVRLFYAFHLMLVFPVIHFSLRASFDAVFFPGAAPLSHSPTRFRCITAALTGGTLLLSLVLPNIQSAFQFVGSAGAATIALTFPGMIALSENAGALTASASDTRMAVLLLGLGLLVTCTGLTSNIHSLFSH